jgi:hypothetical protein
VQHPSIAGCEFRLAKCGRVRKSDRVAVPGNTRARKGEELTELLDRALAVPTWTEVRDLAIGHPVMLTDQARVKLEGRAVRAREGGDEGQALEIDLMRDTLASWARLPLADLRVLDVEHRVPEGVAAAAELWTRFHATGHPADAARAANAWLDVVGSPFFDALPIGARTAYLFDCSEACSAAYEVTAEPKFLDDLLATIDRLINAPILPTIVPGALVRWGKALALRYWAYDDPEDARKALAVFRQSYERAPKDSAERALNLAHYARWLRA